MSEIEENKQDIPEVVSEDVNQETKQEVEKIDVKKEIREWFFAIIVALVAALIIRYFIFTPTMVKQTSMYPTLKDGERLFLSRMIRNFKGIPERGDIITFEAPYANAESTEEPKAYYEDNYTLLTRFTRNFLEIGGKRSYIKRVIALPGEKIDIIDGRVYINDELLEEDYLEEGLETQMIANGEFDSVIVPDDCIYVMGDNRTGSQDSRVFGCIPLDKIEGKVKFRIWPLNKFGEI